MPKGVGYYYGLVPRTYSGAQVAGLFATHARRKGMVGDGDPLDICVLSERSIPHSDILLMALPIGGLSLADGGEADDKIIAVMRDDAVYGNFTDISQCPAALLIASVITRWRLRACMEERKR